MRAPMPGRVSVVIPTCRRHDSLRLAVRSALLQGGEVREVLVIDDNRRPEDEGRVQTVLASIGDPRAIYLRNVGSPGGSASRNVGIRRATGPAACLPRRRRPLAAGQDRRAAGCDEAGRGGARLRVHRTRRHVGLDARRPWRAAASKPRRTSWPATAPRRPASSCSGATWRCRRDCSMKHCPVSRTTTSGCAAPPSAPSRRWKGRTVSTCSIRATASARPPTPLTGLDGLVARWGDRLGDRQAIGALRRHWQLMAMATNARRALPVDRLEALVFALRALRTNTRSRQAWQAIAFALAGFRVARRLSQARHARRRLPPAEQARLRAYGAALAEVGSVEAGMADHMSATGCYRAPLRAHFARRGVR